MELKEILEHHIIDHVWTYLGFGPINLPISKHLLMMAIAALLMLFGLPLIIRSRSAALAPFRSMIEVIVLFLRDDVIRPSMGPKGDAFIGYFSTLFFFILSMNLIGLVPYGATATGNLGVTAALAFMVRQGGAHRRRLSRGSHNRHNGARPETDDERERRRIPQRT